MPSKRVCTRAYQEAIGREPKGFGPWAFSLNPENSSSEGEGPFWTPHLTYEQAEQCALAHFRGRLKGRKKLFLWHCTKTPHE